MALGKRRDEQVELFVPTAKIVQGPGHPFYSKLNEVLRLGGFNTFVEEHCAPFYKEGGRPGIPPGVYLSEQRRMAKVVAMGNGKM